jgi:two-component system, LytTR family, sensor kinase
LLNMAGHCAGALVFGIFLYLLARDRARCRLPGSGLAILAAALAFVWNAGALTLIALPDRGGWLIAAIQILAFGSLSMLAPVLLHLSLGHRCPLAFAGYAMGAVAVCLHGAHVVTGRAEYHVYALGLMAIGLGGVTLGSAVHVVHTTGQDRQTLIRRALGAALLFVFLGTYVHLGLEHGARIWSNELLLHHASVPLALLIIVHSHRFVLLDALLRLCANAGLAALFALACLRLAGTWHGESDLERGAAALGICLLLLLFGVARDHLERFMTRIVFRRGDAARLAQELRVKAGELHEASSYLDWALDRIAGFMRAARVREAGPLVAPLGEAGLTGPALAGELPRARRQLEQAGVEAVVPVRLSSAETQFLLLGRRSGGQPYLSEDLDHLSRLASLAAEQAQAFREAELRRLAARAELRALQAQINPHFLFNALNTLYGLVPRQAAEARQTLLNLADIFRYFLKNEAATTPLGEELRVVEAYLQIETLRLGSGRLRKEICADADALGVSIPLLSIQPLVENAVKHGISSRPEGGAVRVEAHLVEGSLHILVADTGAGFAASSPETAGAGVGLENVARRLRLTYGPEADLRIQTGPEGTTVGFTVPAVQPQETLR